MRIELRRNPQDCKFYTKDGVDITDDLLPYGVKIAPIDARSPGGMESPTVELQCYLDMVNVEVLPQDVKVTLLLSPKELRAKICQSLIYLRRYCGRIDNGNMRSAVNILREVLDYHPIVYGEPPLTDEEARNETSR
jgi:hypothetical protein